MNENAKPQDDGAMVNQLLAIIDRQVQNVEKSMLNADRLAALDQSLPRLTETSESSQTKLANLERDVAGIKEDVATIKGEVTALTEEVRTIKSDVATLKDKVATMQPKVERNESAASGMRTWLLLLVVLALVDIGINLASNTQLLSSFFG